MSVGHSSSSPSHCTQKDTDKSGLVWEKVTDGLFAEVAPVPYSAPVSPFSHTSSSIFATPVSQPQCPLRVHVDGREHVRPGMKFYEWEEKGVPLRLEIGAKDLLHGRVTLAVRHSKEKHTVVYSSENQAQFAETVVGLLQTIQTEMYRKAKTRVQTQTYAVTTYAEMIDLAEKEGKTGWYLVPWHCDTENEAKIKDDSKMTIRCYPWAINDALRTSGQMSQLTCFYSGRPATHVALFGRAF